MGEKREEKGDGPEDKQSARVWRTGGLTDAEEEVKLANPNKLASSPIDHASRGVAGKEKAESRSEEDEEKEEEVEGSAAPSPVLFKHNALEEPALAMQLNRNSEEYSADVMLHHATHVAGMTKELLEGGPPRVPIMCVYSYGTPTPGKFVYGFDAPSSSQDASAAEKHRGGEFSPSVSSKPPLSSGENSAATADGSMASVPTTSLSMSSFETSAPASTATAAAATTTSSTSTSSQAPSSFTSPSPTQLEALNFGQGPTETIMEDGDGAVSSRSLRLCEVWSRRLSDRLTVRSFANVTHFDIMQNTEVVDTIIEQLQSDMMLSLIHI